MLFVISFRTFIFTEVTHAPREACVFLISTNITILYIQIWLLVITCISFHWICNIFLEKGIESFRHLPSKNNDLQFVNNRSSAPPKLPTEHFLTKCSSRYAKLQVQLINCTLYDYRQRKNINILPKSSSIMIIIIIIKTIWKTTDN